MKFTLYKKKVAACINVFLLYERYEHHHRNANKHGQNFLHRLPDGRIVQDLWNNSHCSDINKPSGSKGQDPGGTCTCPHPLCQQPDHGTSNGPHGSTKLQKHCPFLRESRLDQNGKVTYFVWYLMYQNSDSCDNANISACQIRGTNGKPVGEVMSEVSSQIEISSHLDIPTTTTGGRFGRSRR